MCSFPGTAQSPTSCALKHGNKNLKKPVISNNQVHPVTSNTHCTYTALFYSKYPSATRNLPPAASIVSSPNHYYCLDLSSNTTTYPYTWNVTLVTHVSSVLQADVKRNFHGTYRLNIKHLQIFIYPLLQIHYICEIWGFHSCDDDVPSGSGAMWTGVNRRQHSRTNTNIIITVINPYLKTRVFNLKYRMVQKLGASYSGTRTFG